MLKKIFNPRAFAQRNRFTDLYDDDSFDSLDSTNNLDVTEFTQNDGALDLIVEHLVRAGKPQLAKQAIATKKTLQSVRGLAGAVESMGGMKNVRDAFSQKNVARLTFKVTRVTATIAEPLPYVLFGKSQKDKFYKDIITPLLVGATTYSALDRGTFASPTDYVFSYTNAGNTDTIRVSLVNNRIPYTQFIEYLATNVFQVQKTRLRLNNTSAAALAAFGEELGFYKGTMFGKTEADGTVPFDDQTPEQQQTGIIDIPMSYAIDQERFILHKLPAVAGLEMTFTMFISNAIQNKAQA